MFKETINFVNYTFNWHAVAPFATALLLMLIAIIVVVKEKASIVSLSYFYFNLSISFWLACFSVMYCAEVATVALVWAKLAYLAIPFIPVAIYQLTLSIFHKGWHYTLFKSVYFTLGAFFSLLALFGNAFISHVKAFSWGFYPQYGWVSIPFLAFFFFGIAFSLKLYWNHYKLSSENTRAHTRTKLFFIGFCVALLASVDYLIKFNVHLYPIGFIPILFFAIISAYTISKFHLEEMSDEIDIYAIMNHLADALFVVDCDGVIRAVNKTSCRLFKLKEDELIGQSFHALVPEALPPRDWNNLILRNGSIKNAQLNLKLADRELPTRFSATTIQNKEGKTQWAICLFNDVSEIVKADEARKITEERMKRLIESNIIGILIGDFDGRITEANEAFLDLMKYKPGDLPLNWIDLTPPEWSPKDEYAIEELKMKGVATPYEKEYIRKDGTRIPILIGAALLPGSKKECVGFVLDITEQKLAEKKIHTINFELENRVQTRTRELNELIQDLEAFSFSISHDLRTPLALIHGFAKMFLDQYESKIDSEGANYIHQIIKHSKKMEELLFDLLKYSQLGRKQLQKNDVDLEKLFIDVCRDYKTLYSERSFEFKIGSLPHVWGDETMLREVVTNLISNAAKFTKNQPVAKIEITAQENENEVVLKVADNGIGFEMKNRDKLFTVFQRLHSDKEIEGSGAGLAIVHRILQRHGGRIWAESRPGKGSKFYFSLQKIKDKREAA